MRYVGWHCYIHLSCFFYLSRLRAIRHSLTDAALLTLFHTFIATRLDYCNSALFGCKTSCHLSPTVDTELLSSADTKHFQVWANHCSHAWYATLVTSAPEHHVQDLYARPQLCQRVSTDMFTGDLQFIQRRCASTATSLYWPRRPGRAARQHWQIRFTFAKNEGYSEYLNININISSSLLRLCRWWVEEVLRSACLYVCLSVCPPASLSSRISQQELIRRWDSERQLFNDDIAHT